VDVYTALAAGQQQKGAYNLEAAEYRDAQSAATTAAAVNSAERADRLTRTLAAQTAVFAANGVDPSGGSPGAIQGYTRQQVDLDDATGRANDLQKARQSLIGSMVADTQGKAAELASWGQAFSAAKGDMLAGAKFASA
jgi:hypothetical protein